MKIEVFCLILACGVVFGKACKKDSHCQSPYQSCRSGECKCKYWPLFPVASVSECLGPICEQNSDCGDYEYCARGEDADRCACKYGVTLGGPTPQCRRNKQCSWDGECSNIPHAVCNSTECTCPDEYALPAFNANKNLQKCLKYDCPNNTTCEIPNSHCSENRCVCKPGFRTQTLLDGELLRCYKIDCMSSSACGVFELCNGTHCACEHGEENRVGEDTVCLGLPCTGKWTCNLVDQSCSSGRCKCKYGMMTLQGKQSVCKTKDQCSSYSECGENSRCDYLSQKCECWIGYHENPLNEKFTCIPDTIHRTPDNSTTWPVWLIPCLIGFVAFSLLGLSTCFVRRRQRLTREALRNLGPQHISSSTDQLFSTEELRNTHYGITSEVATDSPDQPPPYDLPPPYEEAVSKIPEPDHL